MAAVALGSLVTARASPHTPPSMIAVEALRPGYEVEAPGGWARVVDVAVHRARYGVLGLCTLGALRGCASQLVCYGDRIWRALGARVPATVQACPGVACVVLAYGDSAVVVDGVVCAAVDARHFVMALPSVVQAAAGAHEAVVARVDTTRDALVERDDGPPRRVAVRLRGCGRHGADDGVRTRGAPREGTIT
jgi:hypothetical protein